MSTLISHHYQEYFRYMPNNDQFGESWNIHWNHDKCPVIILRFLFGRRTGRKIDIFLKISR